MKRLVDTRDAPPMVRSGPPAGAPPAEPISTQAARAVAELSGVGWFQVDADRTVTAVSPELEAMTGFRAHEVLGKPCISLIRCKECLRGCGVFSHGHIHDARLNLYRADGSEIDVVRAGRVLHDETGTVIGAVETVRLADPARATQTAEQIETLFGSLGRFYIIADGDHAVMSASHALAELVGIDAAHLIGMPLARLLGDEQFGADGTLHSAMASGVRREGLLADLVRGDGDRLPVSLSFGPIASTSHCGEAGARTAIMIRLIDDAPQGEPVPAFEGIVGRSAPMQRIFRLIELLSDNDATVLITGESGTGKELVARALHARSGRAGPFVAVNCAALPSELLESELFGHVRGAFTGALRDREGRFEAADEGTLFLDEIGDMPPALQVKLLRVLQDHSFERVGDSRTRRVDVRVIAATHVDLRAAVNAGRFREDLFYRLRVVPIHVPPLRERRDDLTLLIPHLLERIGQRRGRALRLSAQALEVLVQWDWPGNVRELENALEYATALCDGPTIRIEHLPPGITAEPRPSVARDEGTFTSDEQDERLRIRAVLERMHYRRDEAAAALGISRTTLWRKMKVYRL